MYISVIVSFAEQVMLVHCMFDSAIYSENYIGVNFLAIYERHSH